MTKEMLIKLTEKVDSDTMILLFNQVIVEIDEEENSVITDDADFISFDSIDDEDIIFYESEEYDMDEEISDFLKTLKKVKKSVESIPRSPKTLWLFRESEEQFILSESVLEEMSSLCWVIENFHKLSLFKCTLSA